MTTEKEKISEMNRLKRKLWNKEPKDFTEIAELGRRIGYIQGELSGESKALKQVLEIVDGKIKEYENRYASTIYSEFVKLKSKIGELAKEQSSGDKK